MSWLNELRPMMHATSVAMTSLRREIAGYAAESRSNADDPTILGRLLPLSGDPEGIQQGFSPLKMLGATWTGQRAVLARLFLYETCSAYERWATSIAPQIPGRVRPNDLLFPETAKKLVSRLGRHGKVVPELARYRRQYARGASVPVSSLGSAPDLVEAMLTVFRPHKELRNSLVHSDKVVTKEYEDARRIAALVLPAAIGTTELPRLLPTNAGDQSAVSLRGVLGLTALVERTARLIDVYL